MQSLAYHEGKQHGTADFPAAYYYVDKDHAQYNMPFHWHKEWEIIRVLQGELLLHADGEKFLSGPGDILLLRDGMLHGGTPINCIYECLVFDLHSLFRDTNSVKKYLRPIYRSQLLTQVYYRAAQTPVSPIIDELLGAFRTAPGNTDVHELLTIGNISRLFAVILQNRYFTDSPGEIQDCTRKISQVKPVLEYIEAHFSSPLTLAELSSTAGMSPKYFCRFFHSITQQTPMEYVNYYRIEKAASLLCSTDMKVTSVSLECGFNDSSYFVKAFKKYKKMTPGQYRRANF